MKAMMIAKSVGQKITVMGSIELDDHGFQFTTEDSALEAELIEARLQGVTTRNGKEAVTAKTSIDLIIHLNQRGYSLWNQGA